MGSKVLRRKQISCRLIEVFQKVPVTLRQQKEIYRFVKIASRENFMADKEDPLDPIMERLFLDVKSIMILGRNDPQVQNDMRRRIFDSYDEDVVNFREIIQKGKVVDFRNLFFMALGEIVFSALLLLIGLNLLIPSIFSVANPSKIVDYFKNFVITYSNSIGFFDIIIIVDFLISILMLVSAFYMLRQASGNLKEAGLLVSG